MGTLGALDVQKFIEEIKINRELEMKFEFLNTDHQPTLSPQSFPDLTGEGGYLRIAGATNTRFLESWIHYFLYRSENPGRPLIIFLEGGPGCAGELQMLNGMSPDLLNEDGIHVSHNRYGWSKVGNLLVIDQPLGSGLSPLMYDTFFEWRDQPNYIHRLIQDLVDALESFYDKYPQFSGQKTYLVAQGYSFHVVSQLLQQLPSHIKIGGFLFANPLIDASAQYKNMVKSAREKGLLDNVMKSVSGSIGGWLCGVFQGMGLTKSAEFSCKLAQDIVEGQNYSNYDMHSYHPFSENMENGFIHYMTQEVQKNRFAYPFKRCDTTLPWALEADIYTDYTQHLKTILDLQLPTLILQGENDLWTDQNVLFDIITRTGWKGKKEINDLKWQDWYLDTPQPIAQVKKVLNLQIVKVLQAAQYPIIQNPQLSLDIITQLLQQ